MSNVVHCIGDFQKKRYQSGYSRYNHVNASQSIPYLTKYFVFVKHSYSLCCLTRFQAVYTALREGISCLTPGKAFGIPARAETFGTFTREGTQNIARIVKEIYLKILKFWNFIQVQSTPRCDWTQRSQRRSGFWKHCLKSSMEMVSRAASDSLGASASSEKRLTFD